MDRLGSMDEYYTLTAAISCREIQLLQDLLTAGEVNANQHYKNKTTALMYAAELGSIEGIHCLVHHGADINARDILGNTAIIKAATTGRRKSVKTLLELGAMVDAQNCLEETALSIACSRGDLKMAQCLAEAGADVNSATRYGMTPLLAAVHFGSIDLLEYLVRHGAKIFKGSCLETLLTEACGKDEVNIVQFLLANVHDGDDLAKLDGTALMTASANGALECVKILLSAGTDLEVLCHDATALMTAALKGHCNICQFLIQAGANVNTVNRYGYTALASAAVGGHVNIVRLLIQAGATADHKDDSGQTPLLLAASSGHTDTVKLLVESGANINYVDANKDSVLTIAAERKADQVISWIFRTNVSPDFEHLNELLGPSPRDAVDTPYPNINHQNAYGNTALIIAARGLHEPSVKSLLLAGADVSVKNGTGCTALEEAITTWVFKQGCYKSIEGSCPTIDILIDKDMCTVKEFYLAISKSQHYIVKRMVERGTVPSLEICEFHGPLSFPIKLAVTPFTSALLRNQTNMAKYFALKLFFHEHDLKIVREDKLILEILASLAFSALESLALLKEIFSQPWTLESLSFVTVSNAIGQGPSRKKRVEKSGLPSKLQRRLLYVEEQTNIPVSDWSAIRLDHLHGKKHSSTAITTERRVDK